MFYHELAYRPTLTPSRNARRHSTARPAAVNVRESAEAYELHLMAPGRAKEDFKISVSPEKMLLVSYTAPEADGEWLHQEYRLHSFQRSVRLSEGVDVSKIAASYENGILIITVPKLPETAQTSLEIPVN